MDTLALARVLAGEAIYHLHQCRWMEAAGVVLMRGTDTTWVAVLGDQIRPFEPPAIICPLCDSLPNE